MKKYSLSFFGKLIFGTLIFALVFAYAPNFTNSSSIGEKQQELNEIENQINKYQGRIDAVEDKIDTLEKQIDLLDNQIHQIKLLLKKTEIEIDKTIQEIKRVEAEIKEKKEELKRQQEILDESVRMIYEESETSYLEVFLSGSSFTEIIDRITYLSFVENKIEQTIAQIEELKKELEEKRADLKDKKVSLDETKNRQEAEKVALADQVHAKARILNVTQGEEARYQGLLSQTADSRDQVEREIAAMRAVIKNRGGGGTPCPPGAAGLAWPTSSRRISCGCYCYYNHIAIDIVDYSGAPIYASASGTVIHKVTGQGNTYPWKWSYGNQVMIDHGNGYSTRYAHLLNNIPVSVGQHVSMHQVIGYMGNTGRSTGTHLHFEIWRGGSRVCPTDGYL